MAALLQQMAVVQAVPGALRRRRPRCAPTRARLAAPAAGRRDAAALQHRAARPRRAAAGARRIQRPGDGAAAHAGVRAGAARAGDAARRGRRRPAAAPSRAAAGAARDGGPRHAAMRAPSATAAPARVAAVTSRRRGSTMPPPKRPRGRAQRAASPAGQRRPPAEPARRWCRRRWANAGPSWSRAWSQRQASPRWCASWRCRPDCVRIDGARSAALAAARRARIAARRALREKLQAALADALGAAAAARARGRRAAVDTPARRDAAERGAASARPSSSDPRAIRWSGPDGAVQDRAHRARLDQTDLCNSTGGHQHHDERSTRRPDEAGPGDAGQPEAAQDELATIEVEGQSGAGLVKVAMTCKHDVKRVAIDPSLLADDKDMLEDLVAAAFNDGGAPRRGGEPGEDGQAHRRHAAAAGHEVAVLSVERVAEARLEGADRRPAPPARRRLKSAQRMAFHLLQHDRDGARQAGRCAAAGAVARCATASAATPSPKHAVCAICLDAARDARQLCVVETPADQAALERTGSYRGLYFVLMGRLSPLDGVGVHDIGVARAARARRRRRGRGGDPGHQLHRRRRGHGARAGRGAARRAACRSRGWRAACRSAASWSTSTWAPSPTRWSTGAERRRACALQRR